MVAHSEKAFPYEINPTLTEKQKALVDDWAKKQTLKELISGTLGEQAASELDLGEMTAVYVADVGKGAPVAVRTNSYRLKTTGDFAFSSWDFKEDPQGDTSIREQLVYTNGETIEDQVKSGPRTLVKAATITVVDIQTTGYRDKEFAHPNHQYWLYLSPEGREHFETMFNRYNTKAREVFELQNLAQRTGEHLNTLPKEQAWQIVRDALIPPTALTEETFLPEDGTEISFINVFPARDLEGREFATAGLDPRKGTFFRSAELGTLHKIVFTDGVLRRDATRDVSTIEDASVAVVRYIGDDIKGKRKRDALLVFVDEKGLEEIAEELKK